MTFLQKILLKVVMMSAFMLHEINVFIAL